MLVMNTSKMEGQAFAKKKLKKRVTDLCKIEEKQIFSIFLQLLKKNWDDAPTTTACYANILINFGPNSKGYV